MAKLEQTAKRLLDTPLKDWTDGQLKFETASQLNEPVYIMLNDFEKECRKLPITRDDMIKYLYSLGGYKECIPSKRN